MTTVTKWFSNVNPVHIGVYERSNLYSFSYWNGEFWGCSMENARRAEEMRSVKSCYQFSKWRGLAEKPA
jgi:hypothetical protein